MTRTPSTLADLLADCDAHGVRLALADGDRLSVDAPQEALTPDLLALLREHKAEILALLRSAQTTRCEQHVDPRLWRDAEAEGRPGWLRTTCHRCGAFVGYRPVGRG